MPFACRCLAIRREQVALAQAVLSGQGQTHPVGLGFGSGWMQFQGGQLTVKVRSLLHYVSLLLSGISHSLSSLAIMHVITARTCSLSWIRRPSYKMAGSWFKYNRVTSCKWKYRYVPNNFLTLRQFRIYTRWERHRLVTSMQRQEGGAPSVPPSHAHPGNTALAHLLHTGFGDGGREANWVTKDASNKNSLLSTLCCSNQETTIQ